MSTERWECRWYKGFQAWVSTDGTDVAIAGLFAADGMPRFQAYDCHVPDSWVGLPVYSTTLRGAQLAVRRYLKAESHLVI